MFAWQTQLAVKRHSATHLPSPPLLENAGIKNEKQQQHYSRHAPFLFFGEISSCILLGSDSNCHLRLKIAKRHVTFGEFQSTI